MLGWLTLASAWSVQVIGMMTVEMSADCSNGIFGMKVE